MHGNMTIYGMHGNMAIYSMYHLYDNTIICITYVAISKASLARSLSNRFFHPGTIASVPYLSLLSFALSHYWREVLQI